MSLYSSICKQGHLHLYFNDFQLCLVDFHELRGYSIIANETTIHQNFNDEDERIIGYYTAFNNVKKLILYTGVIRCKLSQHKKAYTIQTRKRSNNPIYSNSIEEKYEIQALDLGHKEGSMIKEFCEC